MAHRIARPALVGLALAAGLWGLASCAAPWTNSPTLHLLRYHDGYIIDLSGTNWPQNSTIMLAYSTQDDCSQAKAMPSDLDSFESTNASGSFTDDYFFFPADAPAGTYFLCGKDPAGGITSYVASSEEVTIDAQQDIRSISTPPFFVTYRFVLLGAALALLAAIVLIVILRRRREMAKPTLAATVVAASPPLESLTTLKEPATDYKPLQQHNHPQTSTQQEQTEERRTGPLTNQVLSQKYLLGDLLGQGGVGVVYLARNQLLNRTQAIKVLLEHHLSNPKFYERFLREAQVLAALDHANILPVYDFGIDGSRAYLVMPYISGGTLQGVLKRHPEPLALDAVKRYLEHICAALDYAHAQGVVHLDLKPANMLLHQDGRLLLADFGLARLMEEGAVEGGTSLQFGTPAYMAPEHIDGRPGRWSDIYSLGIILYQMLAGHLPFQGPTPLAVIRQQMSDPPPLLQASRPDLSPTLETVLTTALAKTPEERYQAAGDLLKAFQAAL